MGAEQREQSRHAPPTGACTWSAGCRPAPTIAAWPRAAQRGIQAEPLSAPALQPPNGGRLLLGYAAVPEAEIERGAAPGCDAAPWPHPLTSLAPSGRYHRRGHRQGGSGSQPGTHDGEGPGSTHRSGLGKGLRRVILAGQDALASCPVRERGETETAGLLPAFVLVRRLRRR
jgi:hypothetical protein